MLQYATNIVPSRDAAYDLGRIRVYSYKMLFIPSVSQDDFHLGSHPAEPASLLAMRQQIPVSLEVA